MRARFCHTKCADQNIPNMNKYTKLIFVACLSAPLFAIAEGTILYEITYNFDGNSDEHLGNVTLTSTDNNTYTWENENGDNSSSFRADGSVVDSPAGANSGIWLPVKIEQGNVYTLSADVDLTSTSDWISLGYAEHNNDHAFYDSSGYGTAIVKKGWVETFTGSNVNGQETTFTGAGADYQKLEIVLDTTDTDSGKWTMAFYENGVIRVSAAKAASGNYDKIDYIGFTKESDATGEIANFEFSVQTVPEPTQSGLIAMIVVSLVLCSRRLCLGASKVG